MEELLTPDSEIIKEIIELSRTSERKRALKMVRSADSPENIPAIMYNAFQPGTYVQPHIHPDEKAKELWIPIQGRLAAVFFEPNGEIKETYYVSSSETTHLEIPPNTYHTAVAIVEDSVMCEQYFDLYRPESYKRFADWAPSEKDPAYKEYLSNLEKLLLFSNSH